MKRNNCVNKLTQHNTVYRPTLI